MARTRGAARRRRSLEWERSGGGAWPWQRRAYCGAEQPSVSREQGKERWAGCDASDGVLWASLLSWAGRN
jgi:hypothetical protein